MLISGGGFADSRDTTAWVLHRVKQGLHAAKIVRCGDQAEEPVDFAEASQFDLPHGPVEFGPAEDLLHQLAFPLADGEAGIAAFGLGEEAGPLRIRLVFGDVWN